MKKKKKILRAEKNSLQWCCLHVSSSQSLSKITCMNYIAFFISFNSKNYILASAGQVNSVYFDSTKIIFKLLQFFPFGFCHVKIITGTYAQDKENVDYVEWLKGQTEFEEPEELKDMVSRQVCCMIGNCFICFPIKCTKLQCKYNCYIFNNWKGIRRKAIVRPLPQMLQLGFYQWTYSKFFNYYHLGFPILCIIVVNVNLR